jgi:hypothetical protein
LLSISQTDSGTTETVGSYVWTAQYDGLGRRFQTDYAPPEPELAELLKMLDRFNQTRKAGLQPWIDKLDA